jgi:hypothetical protein
VVLVGVAHGLEELRLVAQTLVVVVLVGLLNSALVALVVLEWLLFAT